MALLGALLNAIYCVSSVRAFLDSSSNTDMRRFLVSAIALQTSWSILLIWTAFRPFERRYMLLFTSLPVFLGNVLAGYSQFMESHTSGPFVLNTIIGLIFSALFLAAFFFGKVNIPSNGVNGDPI